MHAYLVLGDEGETLRALKAKPVYFELKKVEDVRYLKKFLMLALTEKTVVVINNFDQASEVAQNAFLKTLEEPQENVSFILTSDSTENILPTILSRCKLVFAKTKKQLSEKQLEDAQKFLEGNTAQKFAITAAIRQRAEALNFLEGVIFLLHKKIVKEESSLRAAELAQLTYQRIKQNGGVLLQLTNFVTGIE